MKVISIIQPWATLIALGEKGFETRSWSTKYRGELAIHASKKVDKRICNEEPFHTVLSKHGYTKDNLPTGVIIAKCNLEDCFEVLKEKDDSALIGYDTHVICGNEYLFGDYTEGRFAWELTDIEVLEKYIPAKGQLGLWNYHGQVEDGIDG